MAMEVAQHNLTELVPETAEETVEETLLIGRRARHTANDAVNGDELSSSDEEEANKDDGGIENLAASLKTVDFQKVLDAVVNVDYETGNTKGEILSGVYLPTSLGHNSQDEIENAKGDFVSGVCLPPSLQHDSQSSSSIIKGSENERIIEEEEIIELEFFDKTAVDKLHTHDAYCPKCSSRITKVILRRVKRERTISIETGDRRDQKLDLLGCLSCFSVFVRIGKKLNPFPIFGREEGTTTTEIAREPHLSNTNPVPSRSATVEGKHVANEDGCFDLCWFLYKRREQDDEKKLTERGGFIPKAMPPNKSPREIEEKKEDDCRIPMEDPGACTSPRNPSNTQRQVLPVEVKDSKSVEIVKCIVYGGLLEAITSLSVVSSAAASDADTKKIVAIGVANLIGGLFVICQNLVDLKYSVGGGSNLRDQVDQYGELLGQRKHYLLHATFALLSYFLFGLVPPVIYGFTFRKSDDKDYKLIAVAVASLLCIIILAAAKAYTRGANKFSKYFKIIMSYVIAAGMASGVGYAAGHLINRLMDNLGWFDSKSAPSLFSPEMISQNPAWASY